MKGLAIAMLVLAAACTQQAVTTTTTISTTISSTTTLLPATTTTISAAGTQESELPVLKNMGVTFGRWDPATNKAGDFLFRQGTFNDMILVPSGYLTEGAQGLKRLPEITYILPVGTPLVSPIDGVVDRIGIIEWSQDYAVHLKEDKNDQWMVSYEHLINLRVAEGDSVGAGQVVGEAAPWNTGGFAELVVWKGGATESDIIKRCPFELLDESLKPAYEENIMQLVADWEQYKGKNIYDEGSWAMPGCIVAQMTEAEAMNPQA